jgi:aldose 1-epimerase
MHDKALEVYKLSNGNGVEVEFIPHGGRILSVKVPSGNGKVDDVVIGYDSPRASIEGDLFIGAICGRYANRIAGGQFQIDDQNFQLDINNGPNHLHGGFEGFNTRVWDVRKIVKPGFESAWELSLVSDDCDQKYPGEVKVTVIYGLTADNSFSIEYEAVTSKPTVINLTSHPYFNLAGGGDVLQHELQLMANKFTVIDKEIGTCTGEIAEVTGTPMDFTKPKTLVETVNSNFPQIRLVDGIDHNFVINNYTGETLLAAILRDPVSGRTMEVYTDQPGIQIYTGNHFDGSETGKNGSKIIKYAGVAMETQIFPNSPNVSHFPDSILKPGNQYKHTCIYKFS